MEDDLKKNKKMEDDLKNKTKKMKTTKNKMENDLNKNGRRTNQPKSIIVNSPSFNIIKNNFIFKDLEFCKIFFKSLVFVTKLNCIA